MNRKKKLNDDFNRKLKKKNDKLRVSNKPKYISKAEREKLTTTEIEQSGTQKSMGQTR